LVCGGTAGTEVGLGKGCFDLDGSVVVHERGDLGQDVVVAHRCWVGRFL
jgi:hypothetical protein